MMISLELEVWNQESFYCQLKAADWRLQTEDCFILPLPLLFYK
jgi:hypothetical protein